MSKEEEKAKEYAGKKPDDSKRGYLDYILWSTKYVSYIKGYEQAENDLSTENAQLKEALRETVTELEKVFTDWYPYDDEVEIHKIGSIVAKAKQILNKE